MNAFSKPDDSWNTLPTDHAAVFIDWENVPGLKDDSFVEILDTIKRSVNPTVMRGYANWCNHPHGKTVLAKQNVELIQMPGLKAYKNSADIKLVVDAVELLFTAPHIRVLILLSGDRDFIPLVHLAKRLGREVWCFGGENSTSEQLKMACDRWAALPDTVLPVAKEPAAHDASAKSVTPAKSVTQAKSVTSANGVKLPEINHAMKVSVANAFKLAWKRAEETISNASQLSTPVDLTQFINCLRSVDLSFDPRAFCGKDKRTYVRSANRLAEAGLIVVYASTSNPAAQAVCATQETLELMSEPFGAEDLLFSDRLQWLRFSGN